MKNRFAKLLLHVFFDALFSAASLFLSVWLAGAGERNSFQGWIASAAVLSCVTIIFSYIFKTYNIIWRFARFYDYFRVAATAVISTGCFILFQSIYKKYFAYSFYVLLLCLLMGFLAGFRILLREYEEYKSGHSQDKQDDNLLSGNIMVIGGGSAGCSIINDINVKKHSKDCSVKCVIDDNPEKKGQYISGALIVGDRNEIIPAVKKYDISMIVFAIPSCSREQKMSIMRICQKTNCKLRIIPSIYQMLMDEDVGVQSIRKVEIEDLLGRDPIAINVESVMNYVENRTVLVTGGGGSIGSELCRQIAAHKPKRLLILDIYENNAYDISNELIHDYPELELITLIGSVRDSKRLNCIFDKYRPDIVYHAAAHKHVPLMEDSPNETLKNNVFGTYKTAQCAGKYGAKKFILISTDKAVNPTNIMGASKRICEMIVQTFNSYYDTEFVAVRFGNVLGSNGSVIPLFKKQIEQGGPVTVTDPNIIRYFMTIPEAVSLVLQAGATAQGGEIFVLDMGEPVRILDLAENLIRLSGYEPYTDIRIEFTGLRPGEKLYEEMLMSEEGLKRTQNQLIYIGQPIKINKEKFEQTLSEMNSKMYDDNADVRALVKRIVPTYNYNSDDSNEEEMATL